MNSTEKDVDDDIVTKIIQKEIRKRRKDKKKTDAEIFTNNYESKSSKDDDCTLILNTSKKKQGEACEIKKNVDPREDVHGFISSTSIKNESYKHKKKKKLKGDIVTALSTTSNILEEDEDYTCLLKKVAKNMKKKNMKKAKKMATQITELPNETKPKHSTCNHKYNSKNKISAVNTEKILFKKNVDHDLIEHKKTSNKPKKDSTVTTYTEDNHGDEEYTSLLTTILNKLKKKKKEATTVSTHVKNVPHNNMRKQKGRIKSKGHKTEYLGNDITTVQQIETNSTKIYECNFCGKNFEFLSCLNKHKAKSHVAHEVIDDAFPTKILTNSESDEECSKLLKQVLKKMKKQHKIKNKVVNRVKTMPLQNVEMQWKQPLANNKEYLGNQKKLPYACRFCRKKLKYFSSLLVHESLHKTERQSSSESHDLPYSTHPSLNGLMGDENSLEKQSYFKCNVCFKLFKCALRLHFHYRVHSSKRSYACDICGKTFMRIWCLYVHYRSHTGERPYVCDVCGSSFMQNSDLIIHHRKHTDQRPYICQVCSKAFTSSANRLVHFRTHSGYRPYTCNTCGKSFNQSHVLTEHIRLHTGEKPYACELCVQLFVSSGGLRKHMLRKHIRHGRIQSSFLGGVSF